MYSFLGISGLSFSIWDLVVAEHSPAALINQEFGLNDAGYAKLGVVIKIMYVTVIFFLGMGASLFEIVTIAFAEGIKHSLKSLSYQDDEVDLDTTIHHSQASPVDAKKISIMFEENTRRYNELNSIVLEYGNLFRYALLILKCCTLLNIYIVVYSVLTLNELSTVVLYSAVTLSQAIRLLILLFSLSFVQFESKKFKESWVLALEYLSKSQRVRLHFIRPIGFVVGNLYVIVPSTVLTFFSTMTTHIIVVLQVFSPKK
jgi:hypothetical protein